MNVTERLYYSDSTRLEFEAEIVESGERDGHFYTVLNSSAFYPTSGGQPHDTGSIDSQPVIDVIAAEDENIWHITNGKVGETGSKVTGIIDAPRRQYFCKLHTAQHLLSRAFIDLFGFETVSVHLGEEYGAVELNTDSVSTGQQQKAEDLSNDIIQQNLPIEIIFADEQQAKQLPLRKKPERTGTIRVIKIGRFDWSACGGTHCCHTAEVGIIKVIGFEKQRNHTLVRFLAGTKARDDYVVRFDVTDNLTRALTCHLTDLPLRFEKLSEENKLLRRQISEFQQQVLPKTIESLAGDSEQVGRIAVVCRTIEGFDPKLLNQLASGTAEQIGGIALLHSEGRLVVAVADNVDADAANIVKTLAAHFDLKGGGSRKIAQLGGASPNSLSDYKDVMIAKLNEPKD